jgi:class 3 adenylate cyclase
VRATLTAALEAYLGRRSAARVLAAPLRRDIGENIQAALLYADLRGFTPLSESNPPAVVISALGAWFDRIAGAIHAFGGEVLKFIGDGVLAIFPVVGGTPRGACNAALRAVSAARVGMAHLDEQRLRQGLPALPFGAALHLGEILWGNIGAADAWISPPSAPPSIWSAGWRGCASRCARRSSCPARSPPRRRISQIGRAAGTAGDESRTVPEPPDRQGA